MNIISPKTMWFLILLVAITSSFLFDHEYLYVPSAFSKFVFIICSLLWLTLICSAFFVHREAYKNSYATSRVVTEGIYGKMRHPMYVGDIALFVGLAFLFPMMWVFVTAMCAILIFIWFMNIEDQVIKERFGIPIISKQGKETEPIEQKQKTIKVKKKEVNKELKKEKKPRASKPPVKKKESSEV